MMQKIDSYHDKKENIQPNVQVQNLYKDFDLKNGKPK
jgi:hypothetical protein